LRLLPLGPRDGGVVAIYRDFRTCFVPDSVIVPKSCWRHCLHEAPALLQDNAAPETDVIQIRPAKSTTTGDAASDEPIVSIEIDRGAAGRFLRDCFDIRVRGRVASTRPIIELRLESETLVTSVASLGDPNQATPATMATRRAGTAFSSAAGLWGAAPATSPMPQIDRACSPVCVSLSRAWCMKRLI
jgi:hypothetical protein